MIIMAREKKWIIATGTGGVSGVHMTEADGGELRDTIPGVMADGRRVFITVPRLSGQSESEALYAMARGLTKTAEARKRSEDARIGRDYARAVRDAVACTLDGPNPGVDDTPGGFWLRASFPNSYTVSIIRNGLSYGGECIALLRNGKLIEGSTDGTWGDMPQVGISAWNDERLTGPDHAAEIATRVAALPVAGS
jgi:hypothetical protein